MANIRGGTHTTLTETADMVVTILERIPGVTRISPGIIDPRRSKNGDRRVTAVYTNAGMELIIAGLGVQKVAVHCAPAQAETIFRTLASHKRLSSFIFKNRERKPGV